MFIIVCSLLRSSLLHLHRRFLSHSFFVMQSFSFVVFCKFVLVDSYITYFSVILFCYFLFVFFISLLRNSYFFVSMFLLCFSRLFVLCFSSYFFLLFLFLDWSFSLVISLSFFLVGLFLFIRINKISNYKKTAPKRKSSKCQ